MPAGRRLWLAAGVGVVALATGATQIEWDGRASIDLTVFIRPDAGSSRLLPDGHVVTDDVCDDHDPCIQAVDSKTALIRRYATESEALAAADDLGADAYRSGWIVVQYKPGGLSTTQRHWLEQGIDGTNVDSPD